MKSIIQNLFILGVFTLSINSYAGGRNSSIPENPPDPVPIQKPNPKVPPKPVTPPPAAEQPVYPRPPTPVAPPPLQPPPSSNETVAPSPVTPPSPPPPCHRVPKQIEGHWRAIVDWQCSGKNLQFARWNLQSNTSNEDRGPHNWPWKYDGLNFVLTDSLLRGAIYQGRYDGFGYMYGEVYHKGSVGCWSATRVENMCTYSSPKHPPSPLHP